MLGALNDTELREHAIRFSLKGGVDVPYGPVGVAYKARAEIKHYRLYYGKANYVDPEEGDAAAQDAYAAALEHLQDDLLRLYDAKREGGASYTMALRDVLKHAKKTFFPESRPDERIYRLVNQVVSSFKQHALAERLARRKSDLDTYSGRGYPVLPPELRRILKREGEALWKSDAELQGLQHEWARERVREVVDLAYGQPKGALDRRLDALKAGASTGSRERWRWKAYPGHGRDGYPGLVVVWRRLDFHQIGTVDAPCVALA